MQCQDEGAYGYCEQEPEHSGLCSIRTADNRLHMWVKGGSKRKPKSTTFKC